MATKRTISVTRHKLSRDMIYYNRCTQRLGRFSRMLCLQSWIRDIGVSLHLWYSYSLLLPFLLFSCFCSTFSYSTRRKATWIHRDCIRLYKKQHCLVIFYGLWICWCHLDKNNAHLKYLRICVKTIYCIIENVVKIEDKPKHENVGWVGMKLVWPIQTTCNDVDYGSSDNRV